MKLKLTLQEAQLLVRHAILSGQITPAANAAYDALTEKRRRQNRLAQRRYRGRNIAMGLTCDGYRRKRRRVNLR